jgi:hypothetical protein
MDGSLRTHASVEDETRDVPSHLETKIFEVMV